MRNSYEVRAQKFIQQVASYIENCEDYCDLGRAMLDFMADNPRRNIHVSHGMARMVLITSDYVVKINYSQDWVSSVGGGEEEIKLYSVAEREGMAYLFAKVSRYEYNGKTYYIMPRIRCIRPDNWHDAYFYMTKKERHWCRGHQVYDLHAMNYGFRNGHVCIFDYGCSNENCDSDDEYDSSNE